MFNMFKHFRRALQRRSSNFASSCARDVDATDAVLAKLRRVIEVPAVDGAAVEAMEPRSSPDGDYGAPGGIVGPGRGDFSPRKIPKRIDWSTG